MISFHFAISIWSSRFVFAIGVVFDVCGEICHLGFLGGRWKVFPVLPLQSSRTVQARFGSCCVIVVVPKISELENCAYACFYFFVRSFFCCLRSRSRYFSPKSYECLNFVT